MRRSLTAVVVVAAITAGCQRPIQIKPEAVEDAQLVARVKTTLVNDSQLGTRIIEVRVAQRIVTLSGQVGSTDEVERAVNLAQKVPGVAAVRSQLIVRDQSEPSAVDGQTPPGDPPVPGDGDEPGASRRRLLAVGGSINTRDPTSARLASSLSIGPLVRLGSGRGLGIAIGFSWFRSDLGSDDAANDTLGRITVRPIMGGVSYTFTDQTRWALSASLVGGVAFNSFTFDNDVATRDVLALEVNNSPVMRPGLSLWVDLNSRVAVNLFTGYIITRPQMTFLESGRLSNRTVRADTAVVNVGVAYKLF
jgi:hyperosmotically inducible protein